jgi:hypothetical protein
MTTITGTLYEDLCKFMVVPCWIILRMFQTRVVEKIKTHISYSIPPSKNSTIYKVVWKNLVGPDDDTIWHRKDVICMPSRILFKNCFEIVPISLKLHCCQSVCTIKVASAKFTGHAINAVCCLLVITSWCFSHEHSPKDVCLLETTWML